MRQGLAIVLTVLAAGNAAADTLVATRTIRAHAVVNAGDVGVAPGDIPGTLTLPAQAIGLEARVMIYAGRPIRDDDLGPPAVVERNQIVTLRFRKGDLTIATEGRAMSRAGVGDNVRAVNLSSRLSVSGLVAPDGTIFVTGSDPSVER